MLLLLVPENYGLWSERKERVTSSNVEAELKFTELALTRSPKAVEVWEHRRWVLSRFPWATDWTRESAVARRSIVVYPRNYYAWHHLGVTLVHYCKDPEAELATATTFHLQERIADCSAFHYRRLVLVQIGAPLDVAREEAFLESLERLSPGPHSTFAWHRRWLSESRGDTLTVSYSSTARP